MTSRLVNNASVILTQVGTELTPDTNVAAPSKKLPNWVIPVCVVGAVLLLVLIVFCLYKVSTLDNIDQVKARNNRKFCCTTSFILPLLDQSHDEVTFHSNFWSCEWNPIFLPFKWNLFSSTWYYLFGMWFLLLSRWTKYHGVTIRMKHLQRYFHMVLFISYVVVVTLKSVDEILWCYHSWNLFGCTFACCY